MLTAGQYRRLSNAHLKISKGFEALASELRSLPLKDWDAIDAAAKEERYHLEQVALFEELANQEVV